MESGALSYASSPTRWQRWRQRLTEAGIVVTSHAVAAGCSVAILVGSGILLGIILGLISPFTASGGDGPGGEALVAAILLAIVLGLLGALLCVPLIVTGIVMDAVRRPLKWPWWLMLAVVSALVMITCIVIQALSGGGWMSIAVGMLWGMGLLVFFCIYWVPLGCAEGILRLLTRGVDWLIRWWRGKQAVAATGATANGVKS